ncbi:unnamed protein product [Blepharisma stoltei]|uniref:J domain-containing protein n=1 Tax=Blepharisma stoltei TaxID=1481888 RepID=A0AAU9JNG3_9CILI|nr:unnamed protein product [Blepharisma stoltei]
MALHDLLFVIGINFGVHRFIIQNPTISHKKFTVLAIAFLYAAFLLGIYLSDKSPNAYQETGISRLMSTEEINKIYKYEVRQKHPDKNPSPYAQQEFIKMQKNFEIIKNSDSRYKYELYKTTDDKEIQHAVVQAIPFYLSNFLLANGITYSKQNGYAGRNALIMIAFIAIYEYFTKIKQKFLIFMPFLPLTICEQIEALQAIFPSLILGMMLANSVDFVAELEKTRAKFMALARDEKFKESVIKLVQDIQTGQISQEMKNFIKEAADMQSANENSQKNTGRSLAVRMLIFMVISGFIRSIFQETNV